MLDISRLRSSLLAFATLGAAVGAFAAPLHAFNTLAVPSAYPTIAAAITAAQDGDVVEVSPGTYLEKDLSFLGKKITVRSTHGPIVTVINAGLSDKRHFKFTNGEGPDSVLQGFWLLNGSGDYGGSILVQNSSPTIRGNRITSTYAGVSTTGAIDLDASNAQLIDNEIHNAGVDLSRPAISCSNGTNALIDGLLVKNYRGGGLRVHSSTLTIRDAKFDTVSENRAIHAFLGSTIDIERSAFVACNGPSGAAIGLASNSSAQVRDCTFTSCESNGGEGGALLVSDGRLLTVDRSTFTACKAARGGAIRVSGGQLTARDCSFLGCIATLSGATGGGLLIGSNNQPGVVLVERSRFEDCSSSYAGGAVDYNGNAASSCVLRDCSFLRNTASRGASVALGGFGPLTIEGCTLSKGNASHSGSAYYQLDGTCTMSNSILWGNGGAAPSDLALVSGTLNVSYCDIEGGWPGAGNVDLDPLFASATNTLLASNSPLIDIGDPAVSGGLDLTGTPRALDGNLDLVQRTDIGAQEFAPVRIAMTGVPSAGQVVQFAATGTPGLLARIVAGAPGAGLTIPPYGTLLVDPFLPMAAVAPFTLLPYSVSPTLPPTLPVGTVLTVQAFGIQFSNAAGAFSNRIQFEVQP